MATAAEISAFRLLVSENTADTYSDDALSDRLDVATDVRQLASEIWLEKAAKYAGVVDMQEGTSRRTLSQLQEHALLMASKYADLVSDGGIGTATRRTTVRRIERV